MTEVALYRAVALARTIRDAGHDLLAASRAASIAYALEGASARIAAYTGRAEREARAARLAIEFDAETTKLDRAKRRRREAREHDPATTAEVTT